MRHTSSCLFCSALMGARLEQIGQIGRQFSFISVFFLLIFFYAISCENTVLSALSALNCSHKTYGVPIDILYYLFLHLKREIAVITTEKVPKYKNSRSASVPAQIIFL